MWYIIYVVFSFFNQLLSDSAQVKMAAKPQFQQSGLSKVDSNVVDAICCGYFDGSVLTSLKDLHVDSWSRFYATTMAGSLDHVLRFSCHASVRDINKSKSAVASLPIEPPASQRSAIGTMSMHVGSQHHGLGISGTARSMHLRCVFPPANSRLAN